MNETAASAARPPLITKAGSGLPTRLVFHGVEGVGKTSWGAFAPKPVFAMTRGETGLLTLIDAGQVPETPHFDEVMNWTDLLGSVRHLLDGGGDYRTFVLDTLNGAERLCLEHVCREQFDDSWASFASYGKGVEHALAEWHGFLSLLDALRQRRRFAVIGLCHTKVKSFRNPLGEDFDRYAPDMHDKFWGLACKWADVVLFGNFEVRSRKAKGSLKAKAEEAEAVSRRVLHAVRTAAWDAKNRLGLPAQIKMGGSAREAWGWFIDAMRKARNRAEETAAPPPAPAPATNHAPAKAKGPSLPANGEELLERLQDRDAALHQQGAAGAGELLQHVRNAGIKAGFSANLTEWGGPAILLAVEETRAFVKDHTEKVSPAEAARLDRLAAEAGYVGDALAELVAEYGARSVDGLTPARARKLEARLDAEIAGFDPADAPEVEAAAGGSL